MHINMKNWVLTVLSIVVFLSGCGGGGGGSDTSVIDCTIDEPDEICSEDLDEDNLTYGMEVKGWQVLPDRFGYGLGVDAFGQLDTDYTVTSDPERADTDGDGLNDYEEFLNKTDPRMTDTDGDGLSDGEEVNRWGTSPLSVDSDGDSRGENEDQAPNSKLFDSFELKIDLVNDPEHSPGPRATNPLISDTDGDGWSDYYEIVETLGQGFDPTIADIPKISIEVTGTPIIRLTGERADTTSWTKDVSVTDTLGQSLAVEASDSQATETVLENAIGLGQEFGFEGGYDQGKWTAKGSSTTSFSYNISEAASTTQAVSWTEGQTRTAEQTYQETYGEGGGAEITLNGGYFSVTVDLINTGDISYILNDLRINLLARFINGNPNYAAVMELKREDDIPLSFGPAQRRTDIIFKSTTTDYELIRSLLKDPSGLMFRVASYDLTDANDISFVFSEEKIKQKSALVGIDYGGVLPFEQYLVATSPSRALDGSPGISMSTIMNDILDIPYSTVTLVADEGSYEGLSAVRGVSRNPARAMKWLLTTTSESIDENLLTDFDKLTIKAGDSIYLVFVKDEDGDGLSAREEALSGTSDLSTDTDMDTLTDYEEIREGWEVKVVGREAYEVKSRGNSNDSDLDGISDELEKLYGLDPARHDSDGDAINDIDEINGFDIMSGSTLVLPIVPYSGQVILDGGDGIDDTTLAGDDVSEVSGPVTLGMVLVSPGPDGVIDSTINGDDYVGVIHRQLSGVSVSFATDPLDNDTDGDSQSDWIEKEQAVGSPNNPGDFNKYIDTDGDGLSDAAELKGFYAMRNGVMAYYTSNINDPDSDDDGLPDLLETMLGSNPSSNDTDGEGLLDKAEYDFDFTKTPGFVDQCSVAPNCLIPTREPSAPEINTFLTNRDTDGDQLDDNLEITPMSVYVDGIEVYQVTFDPNDATSRDDDLFNDKQEYDNGTDPNKKDTDGDTTIDSAEGEICGQFVYDPIEKYVYYPVPWDHSTSGGIGRMKGGSTPLSEDVLNTCRSPIRKDRKLTVSYDSLIYSGSCEKLFGLIDEPDEIVWTLNLGIRDWNYDGEVEDRIAILSWYLDHTESPEYFLEVNNSHVESSLLNASFSIIAPYNMTIFFTGELAEVDGPPGWNYVDAALTYAPSYCSVCAGINMLGIDQNLGTDFTVDESAIIGTTTEFTFSTLEEGNGCGIMDDLSGFRAFSFFGEVGASIEID